MKAIGQAAQRMSDVDAAKADAAGVERVHAGQNLDQRRLAGAVLAQERKNFAGLEGHTDVRERFRAAEALEDAAHLQQFARVRPLVRGTVHADGALASLHRLAPPTKRSTPADWRVRAGPGASSTRPKQFRSPRQALLGPERRWGFAPCLRADALS